MLVTPSSVTEVWARTQHPPLYAVMQTASCLHIRNQTMYLQTISFVSFRRSFMGIFYHDYLQYFGAQIADFPSKFQNQFYSYGLTLHLHCLKQVLFLLQYDPVQSNGRHP